MISERTPWLRPESWDVARLASAWRTAKPFPHIILERLLPDAQLAELRQACEREPLIPQADEIYLFRGSIEPPQEPLLRAFAAELGGEPMRAALAAITGLHATSASVRAYRYVKGDYLLPHSDCRHDDPRLIAFAFYLGGEGPLRGGELQLYDCEADGLVLTRAAIAKTIRARCGRLVLFEVSPRALHRVCEVTMGERLSLAGWFIGP